MKKICTKCGVEKELSDFNKHKDSRDGFKSQCRECCRNYNKQYKITIRESLTEVTCRSCGITKPISEYYSSSFTMCGECQKEVTKIYQLKNPDKVKNLKKKWKTNNKVSHVKSSVRSTSSRRKKDPFFRLIGNFRRRTTIYLKQMKFKKDGSMFNMIGCTPEEFRKYLEDKFLNGMSWDNYGMYGWHIDHIIPISSAKTLEEIKKLSHYTNFQPLWAKDNREKSNKII